MNMAQRLGATTIALWAANAMSATFTVGQGESIQDAIDASSPGDVIELTHWSYDEDLVIDNAGVTIRGVANFVELDGDISIIGDVHPSRLESLFIDSFDGSFSAEGCVIDDVDFFVDSLTLKDVEAVESTFAFTIGDWTNLVYREPVNTYPIHIREDGVLSIRDCAFEDIVCSSLFTEIGETAIVAVDCRFERIQTGALIATDELILTRCTFSDISSTGSLISAWTLEMVDCTIFDIVVVGRVVGALVASASNVLMTNNQGRFMFSAQSGRLSDCRIIDNQGTGVSPYGLWSINLEIHNCLIAGNVGSLGGGVEAYAPLSAPIRIINSTIVDNVSTSEVNDGGGGIFVNIGAIEIVNSAIHGNRSPTGTKVAQQIYVRDMYPTDVSLSHCIVEGGWSGSGAVIIDADPQFVDPDSHDYRLLPASPAVDAGDSLAAAGIPTDIDGRHRILGAAVDIGAFERCPADVNLDDAVTFDDLNILLDAWAAAEPLADLDGSGAVDCTDLNLLLDAWGDSCIAAGAR